MSVMKWVFLSLFGVSAAAGAFETREITDPKKKEKYLQVENDRFRLNFNPLGGRLMSFYFKAGKTDLTNPDTIGSCTENIWNVPASRFFLREKPFQMTTSRGGNSFSVEMTGNHKGGGIDFLQVTKKYTLSNDNALLRIDYDFENIPAAMAKQNYAILMHHNLGVLNEPSSYFYPTQDGIVVIRPEKRPLDLWLHRPARGWMATAAPGGCGVAITMSYPEIKTFYSWFAKDVVPTVEWRMVPLGIEAGKSFRTTVELIPFTGLREIAGAGNGLVGEITAGVKTPEAGDKVPLEIKVYNGYRGKISAELFAKRASAGTWKSIGKAELDFKKFGTVQSFKAEVTQEKEGLLELEAVLRDGKKELARLNANVNFGESEEKWTIAPLEQQRGSSIQSIDLTGFNHITPTEHIRWAKPLPGKKLKVLALTSCNNLPELSQLAQRFDMEQTTTYLPLDYGKVRKIGNPIYGLGDYFGLLSAADVEENLKKVLKSSYDVILIGGLPWEFFPQDARQQILAKVKNGTGLLFIGPENGADFLGLKGKFPGTVKAQPAPAMNSFPVTGIPFDQLGREPVYRYSSDGIIHAKAGAFPYLVEKTLGKGRVLSLTYRATFGRFNTSCGLTPNLLDRYTDHASMHEFYYSLIAKNLLFAARRNLPLSFEAVKIQGDKADFSVKNSAETDSEWEFFTMDRFQRVKHCGTQKIALNKGTQTVELAFPLTQYSGKQTLSVIVRNPEGKVLNWGSWSVEKTPAASIRKLSVDKKFYDQGENVRFQAETAGTTAGQILRVELVDSFGRTVEKEEFNAPSKNSGCMKIQNRLPSRFYELKATLLDNGTEIDRHYAFLTVRPDPELLKWDDYEIGTWMTDDAARFYLWKEQAKILNQLHIRTLISNWDVLALEFPVKYNYHPTMLAGMGLGQRSEPAEYTKTGNKMLLVRNPCLSDPDFLQKSTLELEKRAKAMRGYGLRFYWLGDEQSITGYGGLPVDFCFSKDCLHEFRDFLKQRYGSLETLNQAWDTSFDSWEKVLPMTRKEVWEKNGKHVAGWADHLEFMDGRLENVVRLAGNAARKQDTSARISISGTQPPTAYGGMDWWREMKVFDSLMNYFVGGQEELQRSFSPACEFMPWSWGYSSRGDKAVCNVWETIFLGFRGIMGFHYKSLVNPDWTLPQGTKDTLPHLSRIAGGVGKHILNNLKTEPEVAILYSQPSIRAAFIENRRGEHQDLRMKYIHLLRNMGIEFQFISYEQLAGGVPSFCKVLILPDSTALSGAEGKSIREFVKKGGALVAEGVPGMRESNCRPRGTSPLLDLFTSTKNLLLRKINTKYLAAMNYPDTGENAKLIQSEQLRMENILKKNGVRTQAIRLEDSEGKTVRDADFYLRRDARGNRFFGILTRNPKQRQVKMFLPGKAHVFNLVNGQYYGFTDRLNLPFSQGVPYALVMLDHKPEIRSLAVKDQRLTLEMNAPLDTVAEIRFFAPDGKEAECYYNKLLVKDGKAQMDLPFALSDAEGTWKITVKERIGGTERITETQNGK